MDIKFILFDTRGRISRSQFWLGLVVLAVASAITRVLVYTALAIFYNVDGLATVSSQVLDPVTASLVAYALLFLLFFFPSLALFVKRFHDRNQRATVLYLFYGLFLCFLFLIGDFPRSGELGGDLEGWAALSIGLAFFVYIAFSIVGFYLLIICGFIRGTVGPNDYGEDPVSSRL